MTLSKSLFLLALAARAVGGLTPHPSFSETRQPPSSSGTVAQAGPPSRALPWIRASSNAFRLAATCSTSSQVALASGTFARLVQQEPICPAEVPELTYTNRVAGGPCANAPRKFG